MAAKSAACALAACALGAASAHAQSSVTVYGRINTALEYAHAGTATDGSRSGGVGRLTNNRSVFGLRGEETLDGSLKAIWQIESTMAMDTGAGEIAARNTRIGLTGSLGTLFMGNWHTPYTEATMAYDPYYPTTAGYMALIGNGSASTSNNIEDTSSFDRRQKNLLVYKTPVWRGVSGGVAWGVNEEKTTVPRDPGLYSFAVGYDRAGLNLTAAYEVHQHYQTAGRNDDAIKLGAAYQFGDTRVALVYERLHYRTATGDLTRDAYYASLVQKLGPGSVRVGFARAGNGRGSAQETIGFFRAGADTGATQLTVGYDYPLSKRTALYAYYSRIDNERHGAYDFAINSLGVSEGSDAQTVALGVRHSF